MLIMTHGFRASVQVCLILFGPVTAQCVTKGAWNRGNQFTPWQLRNGVAIFSITYASHPTSFY